MYSPPAIFADPGGRPLHTASTPCQHKPAGQPIPSYLVGDSDKHKKKHEKSSRSRRGTSSVPYKQTAVANQPRQTTTVGHIPPPAHLPPHTIAVPTSFSLYNRARMPWHERLFLGTRKDPLYRISSSRAEVRLRSGLEAHEPVVAALRHKCIKSSSSGHVTLARDGGRVFHLHERYGFTVDVPRPGAGDTNGTGPGKIRESTRPEKFEWRYSRGLAVRTLGRRSGYKLVRLATDAGSAGGELATGGGEVVAVLTTHSGHSPWNKAAKFRFQGSGAQGILGERWQLMAVMTGIGIWDISRKKR
ncbi:hypothetical protein M406DRAFT_73841 [Cryphonectria parasitica EP155]|uniref:Uncharacterized protein n=1 Tax=Cryphonectria parasitica (strain ATCC 38755 / EP155) TaxID=660469 RepID=A0A9P5CMF9_CRYP1|nr:uncharacterized protein M406DRAFT_73841 [Cryphonectria parasitica EP155]KAF3763217.1 hypothetical protein M406DRAFT_73841 [Cryphonectria parasitica EP155]